MKKPRISIIVAIAENRAIGKNNQLLWHIPEDFKHFQDITTGHPVIMGQRTYESIGRPLVNRTNIILTFDRNYKVEGCLVVYSLDEAFAKAAEYDDKEVFVIGGGMVYKTALPYVDRLYLTIVEGSFEADVFFPEYEDEFTQVISEESHADGKYKFKFIELEREKSSKSK